MNLNAIPEILIIIGIAIIITEIFLLPTGGMILPVGFATIITGIIAIYTKNIVILSTIFSLITISGYLLLFIYNKKIRNPKLFDKNKEGIIREKIEDGKYIALFPTGFRGETIWEVYSDEDLKTGDKVKIKDIDGNILIVEKKHK